MAGVWDVLDVSAWEQPLDFWVIFGAGSGVKSISQTQRNAMNSSILDRSAALKNHNEGDLIPDVSRTCSTQEQRRSLKDCVKVGKTHDVIKMCRDGIQVYPPGVVSVLFHQISQQKLTHRVLLKKTRMSLHTFSQLPAHQFCFTVAKFTTVRIR